MTAITQNNPTNFVTWCQNETSNIIAPLSTSNAISEIVRRILIVALFIIPLIGLLAYCLKSNSPVLAERTTLVHATTPIEQFRQTLQERSPTLFRLMNDYQNSINISKIDYEAACVTILAELNTELNTRPTENLDEAITLFQKIREKIGMEEHVFTTSETAAPYAYFVRENGQFNLVINHGTFYRICPQYLSDGTQTIMSGPIKLSQIESYEQVDKIYVSSAIQNNRNSFRGKIPILNSGAMQTCITLLGYLLAPPR